MISLLDLDLISLASSVRFSLFAWSNYSDSIYDECLPLEYAIKIQNYMLQNHYDLWQLAIRKSINQSAKNCRLRKRITKMLESSCLFLTLTFCDDILKSTSEATRHQYISRYLKQFNCPYCANVDYGKLNSREHYHGIIQKDKLNLDSYPYGFIFAEKIINNNPKKLARYINKLVNHAFKDTTKNQRIIYSRLKKS